MAVESSVAEKPILFSGPMIQALRAGRKSQTRRLVKPQPDRVTKDGEPFCFISIERVNPENHCVETLTHHPESGFPFVKSLTCPFGSTGTRLWVKETWAADATYDHLPPSEIPEAGRSRLHYLADGPKPVWAGKTRTSIHMTRWASRLTLEIGSVRVERLQEISEADAQAEGVTLPECHSSNHPWCLAGKMPICMTHGDEVWRRNFRLLWDGIHPTSHQWNDNPFVWVVGFRVVEGGAL